MVAYFCPLLSLVCKLFFYQICRHMRDKLIYMLTCKISYVNMQHNFVDMQKIPINGCFFLINALKYATK